MATIVFKTSADMQRQAPPTVSPAVSPATVPQQRTLADLFTQYEDEYLIDKSRSTRNNFRSLFRQVLRDIGSLPLAQCTPDVFRAWKLRLSQSYQPSTINTYLPQLGRVFHVAVEDYGWLQAHPLTHIRKPSAGRGVVRFLSDEERRRLLVACQQSSHPHLYPIVLLALTTGGRKNEVRRLCWPEVDFQGGVVRYVRTKNKHSRAVPLIREAFLLLQRLAEARDPGLPWVFPAVRGDRAARPANVMPAWYEAKKAAGIQNFRFHDLRHTYASYLAMSGASLRDIAELLGHRNIQHTMIYAHLTQSHTASVVERLAQRFLASNPEQEGPNEYSV
jgi:integrase